MKAFNLALCSFSAAIFAGLVNGAATLNVFFHIVAESASDGNIPVREYLDAKLQISI
jgi:hypothetical protein